MHFATLVNVDDLDDIDSVLEPFASEAEDEYVEFFDETEDIKRRYETAEITAIKLPNGEIISDAELYSMNFQIKDGKIVQYDFKTHLYIDTPKAKAMTILGKKPAKEIYKTYRSYASKYEGIPYDKEHKGYGCYVNPNTQWDWYTIGGRWNGELLVKKENDDVIEIREARHPDAPKAPRGYKWVDGAKISDIEWELMFRIRVNRIIRSYYRYSKMYLTGEVPNGSHLSIDRKNKAITSWNSVVYSSDDTLDDFMKRSDFCRKDYYFVPCANFVDSSLDWIEINDCGAADGSEKEIVQYISTCDKNSYLVMVDCHI